MALFIIELLYPYILQKEHTLIFMTCYKENYRTIIYFIIKIVEDTTGENTTSTSIYIYGGMTNEKTKQAHTRIF